MCPYVPDGAGEVTFHVEHIHSTNIFKNIHNVRLCFTASTYCRDAEHMAALYHPQRICLGISTIIPVVDEGRNIGKLVIIH